MAINPFVSHTQSYFAGVPAGEEVVESIGSNGSITLGAYEAVLVFLGNSTAATSDGTSGATSTTANGTAAGGSAGSTGGSAGAHTYVTSRLVSLTLCALALAALL